MAKEIKLPELGENIESAQVVSVLVKEGDQVEKDQGIIEIETDKATVEVPSSDSGKISKLNVKEGDELKVGDVIIELDEGSGDGSTNEEEAEEKSKKEEKDSEDKEVEKKESDQKEKAKKEEKSKEKAKPKSSSGKGEIKELKVPDLGENIESADIVSVLVSKGDIIEKDQGVIEIETDKATVEVPSSLEGKITEVLVKEGDSVKVGDVLIKVETGSVEEDTEESEDEPKEEEKETKKDDEPKEVDKDEDEKDSEVKETKAPKGERERVDKSELDDQPPITRGAAPAAPSVRRLARELGVEIKDVPGSGPSGRISLDDVKAYVKKLNEKRKEGGGFGIGVKVEKLPDFSKFGETETEPFSKIRSKTAEHLSYAWVSIPHVTQHDKADITNLEKSRKELNPLFEKEDTKLTVTAILIKVLTQALRVYPQFNSSIDMENQQVIFKKYFNIGVAVDTEHGLIVPVVKNADQKNLIEISKEMNELAEKARHKKIGLDDLQGGSMTITNLGGLGGTAFTPIVNTPEVAILGVSRGSYEPVYNGHGAFEPRLMLPLSLSYDHRIIDGADAVRFLRWVVEALEEPLKLLM